MERLIRPGRSSRADARTTSIQWPRLPRRASRPSPPAHSEGPLGIARPAHARELAALSRPGAGDRVPGDVPTARCHPAALRTGVGSRRTGRRGPSRCAFTGQRPASGHLRGRAGAASRHRDAATADSGRGRVGVADGASAVGHVRMVGLQKLLSGPNTQVTRDRHVPLLDVGSMDQIRQGHINVHGDLDRCTEDGVVFSDGTQIRVDAVVLATGYRASMGICWSDGRPSVTVLAHQRSPGRPRHSRVSSSAGCTSRPEAWDRLVRRAPWCRRS